MASEILKLMKTELNLAIVLQTIFNKKANKILLDLTESLGKFFTECINKKQHEYQ